MFDYDKYKFYLDNRNMKTMVCKAENIQSSVQVWYIETFASKISIVYSK